MKNFGTAVAKQEKILKCMEMIIVNEECILENSFFKTKAPKYHFKNQTCGKQEILPGRMLLLEILRQRAVIGP